MEKNTYKKLILDRFQEHVQYDYDNYCERHNLDNTNRERLLTFLIDQDLIPPAHIQRYTVLHEFEQVLAQQELQKTRAVLTLAHRFSISERTVWSILRQVKGK